MSNIKKIAKYFKSAKVISTIRGNIQINLEALEFATTQHSEERQVRHQYQGVQITEREIVDTLKQGMNKVINDFANGEIPNNSTVLITNSSSHLNVVAQLIMKKGKDEIKIITVMKKKGFQPKPGTFKYVI